MLFPFLDAFNVLLQEGFPGHLPAGTNHLLGKCGRRSAGDSGAAVPARDTHLHLG